MLRATRAFVLALAFAAVAWVPVAAQDSVAGKWLVTVSSPEIGEMQLTFEFEQSGTEVTGTADLSSIPEIEASQISDGLYEDKILSFLLHLSTQGQWMTVEVEADVDDDEMVGDVYLSDMGTSAPFTAKRADN
jgi:hypothetical protein